MEYSIEHKRELSEIEIQILYFLLSKEKPEFLSKIDNLKVIYRCGCGNCPTILFGNSYEDEILSNQKIIADYFGYTENKNLIGVTLFGNETRITELEFYSIDGQVEFVTIPKIETLQKM